MEKSLFFEKYRAVFEANGLEAYATEPIMDKMHAMVSHMLEVNAHTNLTAITDWEEIIVKHLADCCLAFSYIPKGARVLDVGCGGGFPCLPMAIVRPDLTVVGLDSTGKKVDYVNESAVLLGLSNLSAICGRAEDLANTDLRESFDVVTARAVAALPILCELCAPFVKVGGVFCALKGARADEEVATSLRAAKTLSLALRESDLHRHSLKSPSGAEEERCIVVAQKKEKTDKKYPRPYVQIKKKPL